MVCLRCNILRKSLSREISREHFSTNFTKILNNEPKGMEDIPSPRGLPWVGTTLSLIMAGSTPKLHWYIDRRHKELGPIFRENIGPVPCVFISDPEAMRLVFAQEGKYPIHLLPEAWTTYNTLHNVSRGLFFMNGEEWLHFRRILNPLLLKGDQAWLEDSCLPAVSNLIEKIKNFPAKRGSYPDIEKLLYHWSLEVITSLLIGPQNYKKHSNQMQEQLTQLASTVQLVFETSSKLALISSSFASKYRIPRWKKFEIAVTSALKSATDLVDLLTGKFVKDEEGLLGKLRGQMTANELTKIITDLILAAGDTTAYSMEWMLYLVGKYPEVQDKLRRELIRDEREGLKPTANIYLKNIVKESLRLYPVAPFLTRVLPENITLKDYNIPKGTIFILSIFTTGRDANNFKNPLDFDPNRWNRNEIRSGIAQSAALPFAIGARSCIGKKLAEYQLQSTLGEIVRSFEITVDNKNEVDVILKMVAVPSEHIKLKFKHFK